MFLTVIVKQYNMEDYCVVPCFEGFPQPMAKDVTMDVSVLTFSHAASKAFLEIFALDFKVFA